MKAGWQAIPIGELSKVFTDGDWIESKDQSAEGIRLIQTGNVGEGVFKDRAEKARYISDETFKQLRCTEIFSGDCLVSRLPDPVGRCCILPDTGERMITAVDCTIIRFDESRYLSTFFNYYAQSTDYLSAIVERCTGTTRTRISRGNLALMPAPVPPVEEQHRIVGILNAAFAEIATAKANAKKHLQNARALFESYLKMVFIDRGEGWQTVPFGEIAAFRNGINFTKSSRGTPIKILGVKDFQNHYWAQFEDFDSIVPEGLVPDPDTLIEGDIVFVRSNGNPDLIGRCLLIGQLPERTTHSGFTIKARLQQDSVLPAYLCHFLKSKDTRQEMIDGGNGANIKSLNQGTLSRIVVPFPSLSKQAEIVRQLEDMQVETQRLESLYQKKLAALDELKKSLLHQAFSGAL